jgi:hypothetical protein
MLGPPTTGLAVFAANGSAVEQTLKFCPALRCVQYKEILLSYAEMV